MKPHPRQCIQAVGVAIAIAALGFYWGDHSARDRPRTLRYRVTGNSMAPTFVDQDVCQIRLSDKRLRIGDVVAIRWNDKRRIKRIAALGGDRVDVADGRLLVNGQRLEDLIARREPRDFLPPARVAVASNQDHWRRVSSHPEWLIYTHHNPHQTGRVTPVMDDYPINRSVRRTLNPVDRLAVKIAPIAAEAADRKEHRSVQRSFQVVFFDFKEPVVTTTRDGLASWWDATRRPVPASERDSIGQVVASLDASHPVAVKMSPVDQAKFILKVFREIEFRDSRPSASAKYPITLLDDEVFLVGDNVPVSIDSRRFGPLKSSAILGHVERMETQP